MKLKAFIAVAALLLAGCEIYLDDSFGLENDRRNFIGRYAFEEFSTTYGRTAFYDLNINRAIFSGEVYLDNFYGLGLRVRASVSGNRIYIHRQTVGRYEISGEGYLRNDRLHLNYTVWDTADFHAPADRCEGIGY